uniref:Protein kinase domain-containing protein n=1 Tax=Noctiluca scintillans TaxID=2966 RepID=A0A7S1F2J1_NOCSC
MDAFGLPLKPDANADNTHIVRNELQAARFSTVKISELVVVGLLGSGGQGDVYKAEWIRKFFSSTSSIVVAVKRLHPNLGPLVRDREAVTMMAQHKNLVTCFDVTHEVPYLIVSEFCAGGSLHSLLYVSSYDLTARQSVTILHDVASGMNYLHNQTPPIVHRDMKSSNILLTSCITSPDQEPCAKLSDFGLSRNTDPMPNNGMTKNVGTWRWMAPEVIDVTGDYDERADIFSFAMVLFEVMQREVPYAEIRDDDDPRISMHICILQRRPRIGNLPQHFPAVLPELMKRCWNTDADLRPTAAELQMHFASLLATL